MNTKQLSKHVILSKIVVICMTLVSLVASCSDDPQSPEPEITVSATSLNFSTVRNAEAPGSQDVEVNLMNCDGPANWSAEVAEDWLIVSPSSGSGHSAKVKFEITDTKLAVGKHTSQVSFFCDEVSNSPQIVVVNFVVSDEEKPRLMVGCSEIQFNAKQDGDLPIDQNCQLSFSNNGFVNWSIEENVPWLDISPLSGTGAATIKFSVNSTGLPVGSNEGTVVVRAGSAQPSISTIKVNQVISDNLPGLALDAGTLSFIAMHKSVLPNSQNFGIVNTGGKPLKWIAQIEQDGQDWLDISPSSGTIQPGSRSSVTVLIQSTEVRIQQHVAKIRVSDSEHPDQTSAIDVEYDLQGPHLKVSSGELVFSGLQQRNVTFTAQPFSVQNAGRGSMNWQIMQAPNWLNVSRSSGANDATILVSPNTTNLDEGEYFDYVYVMSEDVNPDESPARVAVRYDVIGPIAALNSQEFSFKATRGQQLPESKQLTIGNSGGGELGWSIEEDIPWLSVTPTSGVGNSEVTLSVTTTDLTVGQLAGEIRILSNGKTAEIPINVGLTIMQAPSLRVTPDYLKFQAVRGQQTPSSQYIEIINDGGGELNWSIDETTSWLDLSQYSGVTPNSFNLKIDVNATNLMVGVYRSTITIKAHNADNLSQLVIVEYEIVEPAPVLCLSATGINFDAVQNGSLPPSNSALVSNCGGATLNWTATENVSWLDINPKSGTNAGSFTVQVLSTELAKGVYTATITVSGNPGVVSKTLEVKYTVR